MKLVIENGWTGVPEASAVELEWLEQYLSSSVSHYRESRYGAPAIWAHERVCLLEHGLFPTGLAPVVARAAKKDGFSVEWQDARVKPAEPELDRLPSWLRDYQVEGATRALKMARGVLRVPMAGGKTEIFIAMTLALPVEWLFVVHSIDVAEATISRYHKWTGEQAGTFKQGVWHRGTSNVTVTGSTALWRGLKLGGQGAQELCRHVQAVNVDEAHGCSAETLWRGVLALEAAYWRIGQSGTPLHRDELANMRVVGALGPLIYELPTAQLVASGEIARTKVRMVACVQGGLAGVTWRGVYSAGIRDSRVRNRLLADMAVRAQKPCLLFVEQIKHGAAVLKELRARGVSAEFVHGAATTSRRKEEIRRLSEGEIDVLVANDIFKEGVNVPAVRSTINGAGKETAIATLQRAGRAMRKKAEGDDFEPNTCETWDVFDEGHKWLAKHALARKATYENEGFDVEVIQDLGV